MATGTAVASGDIGTAAKMNLKQEDGSALTVLGVLDQSGTGAEDLRLVCSENLSANRNLTITVNDAARAIDLSGNLTLAAAFTTATAAITLTANGAGSSVTLPASGTLATLTGAETLTNKTLTTPVIASLYQDAGKTLLVTMPAATDTLVGRDTTDTLTLKTLTTPVIASLYQDAGKTLLVTMPAATDTLVGKATTDTLTNKTLTTPVIASLYQDAGKTLLLTMPAATDTLVGKATTDTLTNKTLTAPTINAATFTGAVSLSGTTTLTGTLLNMTAAATFTMGTTDNNILVVKTNAVNKFAFTVTLGQFTVYQTTANYTLIFSDPAAARNITFADPLGHDSVAYLAASQTLSGKTVSLAGNLTFASALDIVVQAATAVALELSDGATKLLAVDTRVAVDNVEVHTWTAPAPTFAAAAGSTWIHQQVGAVTVTLTGNTGVTAMSGLQMYLSAPTITSAGTPAVALASTLYVAAPVAAGTATITAGYSAHFASQIRVDGNISLANAGYDLVIKADTAAALELYDATTKLLTINSQITTDSVAMATITGQPVTVAAAAGSTYSTVKVAARTHTFTGNTGVTAMSGMQLYLDTPTITSGGTPATALASTLYVAAPAAAGTATITAGYSAHFASAVRVDGNLSVASAAADLIVIANTAVALEISDGTTKLLAFDSRNTVTGVTAALFSGSAPTIVSAAGTTYSQVGVAAKTITLTGGVGPVTALSGLQLNLAAPTVTSEDATTITLASTLYVAAPVAAGGGPAAFTAAYSGHFASQIRVDGNINCTAGAGVVIGTTDANTLAFKTGDTTRFTIAAAAATITAAAAATLVCAAATAATLQITDATTALISLDSRIAIDNIAVMTIDATNASFASAAGTTWRLVEHGAVTVTVTGGTGVTAMSGLSLYLNAVTLAAGQATTVTTASQLYLTPVTAGANMTITNNYMVNTSVAGCYLTAAGVWTDAPSTIAIKKNVTTWDFMGIERLLKEIRAVKFQYDQSKFQGIAVSDEQRYGIIAEELPQWLRSPGDHQKHGISGSVLATFNLAAVKWLQEENEELKARVAELERLSKSSGKRK